MDAQEEERAWRRIYRNNKGAVLILLAELVATTMDACVRWLQNRGTRSIHPFQIIFARMMGTFILSTIYMYWTKVPDFPFGQAKVRGLLVIRAVFGFSGLFCLYYSIRILPLAEATVFRFLVPIVTAIACAVLLGTVFSRKDLVAGVLALAGVVIIAHPSAIFGIWIQDEERKDTNTGTAAQRLAAIAISLLGVVFASAAYTMIRMIGDRAHALISVNYFAVISIIGSTLILHLTPGIGFTNPGGAREWILLTILGILGFVLQFLLTAGLQMDKSSKATSMMYSQVVFALLFDFGIWHIVPSTWSIVGGLVVMGSTLWAALQKMSPAKKETSKAGVVDEERPLLGDDGLERA